MQRQPLKYLFVPAGEGRRARAYGSFGEVGAEDVELLIDKNSEGKEGQQKAFVDRKDVEEKHIKKNLRKPPKPPRPPRSLSLDASDQKLMKEITELAMRKRARIERHKALKKMRAAKTSSWSSSLSAMVITIVFCLIIIYQGILAFRSFDLSQHKKLCFKQITWFISIHNKPQLFCKIWS